MQTKKKTNKFFDYFFCCFFSKHHRIITCVCHQKKKNILVVFLVCVMNSSLKNILLCLVYYILYWCKCVCMCHVFDIVVVVVVYPRWWPKCEWLSKKKIWIVSVLLSSSFVGSFVHTQIDIDWLVVWSVSMTPREKKMYYIFKTIDKRKEKKNQPPKSSTQKKNIDINSSHSILLYDNHAIIHTHMHTFSVMWKSHFEPKKKKKYTRKR